MLLIDQLLALTAAKFKIDKDLLHADDDIFSKLNINSLQVVDLLTDIESHFDVEIPDYELKNVTNFRQLADKIQMRL